MSDELLLWLDLETTGLDEHAGDEIVEIGCILTTEDLIELGEFSSVVTPSTFALSRMMNSEFVMEMHKSNGLLESLHHGDAPQISEAQDRLISFLDELREPKTLTLAGSGVAQFDIRFVRAQMPRLAERLNYFTIDVGVIRRSHAMWVGSDVSAVNDLKTHRAMDDVRCHLDEARAYRALWISTQRAVPTRDAERAERLVELVEDIFESEERTMGSTFDSSIYRHHLDELR